MSLYTLVRIQTEQGARAGLVVGDSIYDVADATGRADYVSAKAILVDWKNAEATLQRAAELRRGNGLLLTKARLLAPVEDPGAIFCAGANYKDHLESMARAMGVPPEPDPHDAGLKPWHFLKTSSSIVGPDAEVTLKSTKLDWEAELAAVIGRPAQDISVDRALDSVAGYMIANDLSARDRMMRATVRDTSPFKFDWVAHKSFDGACPLGPALIPAAAIKNPQSLAIKLWVNDVLKQDSNTSQMIFTLAEQISQLSTLVTLQPGDIVLTGTPAGVGAEHGEFLKRGDTIRIEIEMLGRLSTTII
jgi:2-keto-4-pentenoate hydratase/2-oxohepta-3-ene-1,7-dioic acid hydratase in catechol pathway